MLYLSKNPSLLPLPDGLHVHFYDPLVTPAPVNSVQTMFNSFLNRVFTDNSSVTFHTVAGSYCRHVFEVGGAAIEVAVPFDPLQPMRAPSLAVLLRETYTQIIDEQTFYAYSHFAIDYQRAVVTLEFVDETTLRVIASTHTATINASEYILEIALNLKRCLESNGVTVLVALEGE